MYYAAIIVSWIFFGALHSLTATRAARQWICQRSQLPVVYYRLVYNGLALLTFVPVMIALEVAPTENIGTWAGNNWIAAGVLLASGVLGWVALRGYDLAEFTGWPLSAQAPAANQFRQQGLLRHIRHPLYSSTLGLLLGLLIAHPDWKHLLFTLAATLYLRIGIHFEEQKLIRQFGDDYRQYRQRTPMLVPYRWKRPA